jgi:hypothetical protein
MSRSYTACNYACIMPLLFALNYAFPHYVLHMPFSVVISFIVGGLGWSCVVPPLRIRRATSYDKTHWLSATKHTDTWIENHHYFYFILDIYIDLVHVFSTRNNTRQAFVLKMSGHSIICLNCLNNLSGLTKTSVPLYNVDSVVDSRQEHRWKYGRISAKESRPYWHCYRRYATSTIRVTCREIMQTRLVLYLCSLSYSYIRQRIWRHDDKKAARRAYKYVSLDILSLTS